MNPKYNKYKKYKFKYEKIIEPFKEIIDKIDISNELLNETYLKNKNYFDNLINIKNEGDVYKYKYHKYKTRYLIINKTLNGGAGFTNNTQDSSNEGIACPLSDDGSSLDNQRKKLTENQKILYYGSKGFKIGSSVFFKFMAIASVAIPGAGLISAGVAVVDAIKNISDYTTMKKYEFIIIYSIFIFLRFNKDNSYFIGEKDSLVKILSNYKNLLDNDNQKITYFIKKNRDDIYFKLKLLNEGMVTVLRYNSCMVYLLKFIKEVSNVEILKGIKDTFSRYYKNSKSFLVNILKKDNNKEYKMNKNILNYLVKEKKIMKSENFESENKDIIIDINKEKCRIDKLINIINSFKKFIDDENKKILDRYKNTSCLSGFDETSKLKLIYLLESSYVYAFTNKNSNAILLNGLYNIILQNSRKNKKISIQQSNQIINIYELLGVRLKDDLIVKTFYSSSDMVARKYKKKRYSLKSKIYTTEKNQVTCTTSK